MNPEGVEVGEKVRRLEADTESGKDEEGDEEGFARVPTQASTESSQLSVPPRPNHKGPHVAPFSEPSISAGLRGEICHTYIVITGERRGKKGRESPGMVEGRKKKNRKRTPSHFLLSARGAKVPTTDWNLMFPSPPPDLANY